MPLGDKMYAKRRTGFKINGTDNGSGVEQILIRVDGAQEWTTYSNVLYFDTEKEHSIEAKAIDAVGNESDVRKITFIVDDNPPTTDLRANVE
jgi:predicted lipoprotein with Yx(FWY)xxD motif